MGPILTGKSILLNEEAILIRGKIVLNSAGWKAGKCGLSGPKGWVKSTQCLLFNCSNSACVEVFVISKPLSAEQIKSP